MQATVYGILVLANKEEVAYRDQKMVVGDREVPGVQEVEEDQEDQEAQEVGGGGGCWAVDDQRLLAEAVVHKDLVVDCKRALAVVKKDLVVDHQRVEVEEVVQKDLVVDHQRVDVEEVVQKDPVVEEGVY
ncbi:hypothetical protein OIU74_027635 [Salix koriyanagi]|uniref:Uncharacterized protein n=1 Tax=Salix koriyanagi TaxID=2511006 RepID=A0A9Q0VPX5_9ROSI|nr:hypothetical protein OIU74_027635 [Salix koriyanagi]